MKKYLMLLTLSVVVVSASAQLKIKDKKYQSLLWEITGNGLSKPSYLIGTMHVSSKLAFHLSDSFYSAIRRVNVVALETNPETWQEDMSKYDFAYDNRNYSGEYVDVLPADYLNQHTLKFYKYEDKIKNALFSKPAVLNSLLYRSIGNEESDFEEDTYLDMYIFQTGKKLGKKITGVEDYGESMKLMAEAYQDAIKDKNKKQRSYEYLEDYSEEKLQEAYRNGDLDVLDSINRYNSVSAAFDEKFLYRRNEIQAISIDSIIKSGSTLFVGVGAAHLPGPRGVIEILRSKGYRLRPVKMGERDSRDKELIEKIRVPVVFNTTYADDSLFKVDIPGRLFPSNEGSNTLIDERQFADMANGGFYMVSRIMTHAWLWGHNDSIVLKKVDSLLYENIPGKILTKTMLTKSGFKGFDVTNRTRRGDLQRYNIFITPFEVVIFKMGGNGDYLKNGEEAAKFFNSIQFLTKQGNVAWKKFIPSHAGFAVDMPHKPFAGNDGSWLYDATDNTTATQYRVIKTDIHNYNFAEEDSFDLNLLNESFIASEFIDSQYFSRKFKFKGYPAMDGKYRDKSGQLFLTRFVIQGPHYYTLIAHGRQETKQMNDFLNSFEILPFVYGAATKQTDTNLYYTVTTPVFPGKKKIKLDMPVFSYYDDGDEDEDDSEEGKLETGTYRSKLISNDTTGEKIYISFERASRYYYSADSSKFNKLNEFPYVDSGWKFLDKKTYLLPNAMKVWETKATQEGSSRTIWSKTFYKDGITFNISSETDTLTKPSPFLTAFYNSFTPADTLKGVNPFVKKSDIFFDDFLSKDSVVHKRALAAIETIELDSTDLPRLKNAIASLTWEKKNYLQIKKSLVNLLGDIKTNKAADYLKEMYFALGDTVSLQYTVLENLLQQKTKYAFAVFSEIINTDPPVKDDDYLSTSSYTRYGSGRKSGNVYTYDNGEFMDELSDTLQLTKTILPDLLPLLNLSDYKEDILNLMGRLIDSSLLQPSDYELYFSKFYLEARQELKRQAVSETKKSIDKAEEGKKGNAATVDYFGNKETDYGNDDLSLYAKLLLPFDKTKPVVKPLLQKMLSANDKRLKFNTFLLLLQNNKDLPDTMYHYFGNLDEYRYELYNELKKLKRLDLFPPKYNNKDALAKSRLLYSDSYSLPDTLVFLNKLPLTVKGKKGYVYFYKYKSRKTDLTWKLASAGMVAEADSVFEYEDGSSEVKSIQESGFNDKNFAFQFNNFLEDKLNEEEPVMKQLDKLLKKLIYAKRKSAAVFYNDNNNYENVNLKELRY